MQPMFFSFCSVKIFFLLHLTLLILVGFHSMQNQVSEGKVSSSSAEETTENEDHNQHTTYFLLDIQEPEQQDETEASITTQQQQQQQKKKNKRRSSHSDASTRRSSSSSSSTSSSVSAQVVIDHGHLRQPHQSHHASFSHRLDKHANHLFRSGDDESESDYAYSFLHHIPPTNDQEQNPQSSNLIYHESSTASVFYHDDDDDDMSKKSSDPSPSSEKPILDNATQQQQSAKKYNNYTSDKILKNDENDDDFMHRTNPHNYYNDNCTDETEKGNNGTTLDGHMFRKSMDDEDDHAIADDESENGSGMKGNHMDNGSNNKRYQQRRKKLHRRNLIKQPAESHHLQPSNDNCSSPLNSSCSTPKQSLHYSRKLNKRAQRILEANLHSHSWSRRESLQPCNYPAVGLSSDEALQKLLSIAQQILDEERGRIQKKIDIRDWLYRPENIFSFVCAMACLAYYIAGYLKSDPYQYRITGALIETILILLMTIWNGFLYYREQTLTCYEMTDRATTIMEALKRSGMNMVQDIKIPFIPSMTVAKVVRDGVVRIFPVNLLVEGDIVEMIYGDVAPGRMKYIHQQRYRPYEKEIKPSSQDNNNNNNNNNSNNNNKPKGDDDTKEESNLNHETNNNNNNNNNNNDGSPLNQREYYLAENQAFKPSFFGIPPPSGLMEEYLGCRGRYQFTLLETPLEEHMRTALSQTRPKTVIMNEARVLFRILYGHLIWYVLGISLVINLLVFGLKEYRGHDIGLEQLVEQVFWLPFLAVLPLLPLCVPSLWLIARSFGNAQLLILFEALQISKTEYEDDDEVDEFDTEAPPPTKDLELSPNAVWDRFCSLLNRWDRLSLTRSTNLLESLGSTTVICCLDREGTIANPFPTAEQLMFPNNEEDTSYLDLEEDSDEPFGYTFEDEDWESYLPQLKPVGLNFMLNTNCGVVQGRKRTDYHRKRSKLQVYGRTAAARQACICRLGKCIGFRENSLQSFALRAEIYTFAPYHDILMTPRYQFSQYYEFEVPNALSTVFEERSSGSYQLLTDGHPALVLDKCSDYWDGTSLQTMSSKMEKKIHDFFQNAEIHDMQCIAYAYRPINTSNGGRIPFLNPSDDENEDPGCAFVVLPYKPPSNDSSSSDSSSSSSDMSSSASIDHSEDFTTTKKVHQGKTSPSSPKNHRSRKTSNNNNNIIHHPSHTVDNHDSSSQSSMNNDSLSETDYSFEDDEPVDEQEEETFYKEVVKGQIFLGMAAMCHQPKQNVVDFIEDLGLAGIRFVYFSHTAERESKAFAERLGLETDWNSCILLSNPDDEHCGNGYIQTHDIKAQLPRGIDQIRPHLENVDDIPLHVSLFAECAPPAIKEMIRIFQENGEVVCCIGNALNIKNTESFALADISIGMEPMHTRAQSRGRLSLNGRQPPLAVGASLVSLPCGLFMQYETSLYAVTQLIRDARRLLTCVRTGFVFYLGTCMALTCLQMISFCTVLPPILTGYQILWVLWIILPILTLSMLFTPLDDNIMLLMPGKNIDHLTDMKRFFFYFVLRFILLFVICLAIFIMSLVYGMNAPASQIFGLFGTQGWLHWTNEQQWAVILAQNFMLIIFVWCIAWMSATFLHRTYSLREFIPFRNKVWIGAFVMTIILQFCFCAVSLAHCPIKLDTIPWYVYFIGFISPVILVPTQELVKLHDEKEFIRFQKRSKLEFSTKLGMHSPL
ncbi:uncharacterized protein BX664DRAFT_344388 [Halteromyces radiatus]|uniref:uncharacterized protein n=1 Tax=Halteromyces radiatus TaxID=101107 RepID=UPI00221FEB8C|nr:uncharacterized protein BX664DRAFT_344388 [Halteromyces radiatus]KAI8076326.1 hypothetical protein BX664DRAFT_344388 [Halteromyces radiatus]